MNEKNEGDVNYVWHTGKDFPFFFCRNDNGIRGVL